MKIDNAFERLSLRIFLLSALLILCVAFPALRDASAQSLQGVNSVVGNNLVIGANGEAFMVIGTSGLIGIGTSDPTGFPTSVSSSPTFSGILNINPNGGVGIGTTSPIAALDLAGAGPYVVIEGTDASFPANLLFQNNVTGSKYIFQYDNRGLYANGNDEFAIWNYSPNPHESPHFQMTP